MRTSIGAWTRPTGPYPDYVSVNHNPVTNEVEFIARDRQGNLTAVQIPFDDARQLLQGAVAKLSGIKGAKRAVADR